MKKVISIIIALCLVFASILPVYAVDYIDITASNSNLGTKLDNIYNLLNTFFNSNTTGTWATFFNNFNDMVSYLADSLGNPNSSVLTVYTMIQTVATFMADYVTGWEPMVTSIFQTESNTQLNNTLTSTGNNYLNAMDIALTNYFRDAESVNVANRKLNTHTALVNSALEYKIKNINSSNVISEETLDWQNGSPLGNIAVILHRIANNDTTGLGLFLDHTVGTTFGIWDSRDSLIPVEEPNAWTPYSAVHGLYTYLAYLQRDVALMSWVVSNPSDLVIRQDTEQLNAGYYDNFVDPDSDNTVTRSDMDEMGDLASGFKDNFSTGQSASNVFSIFSNGSSTNWFSQATKNALDQRQTRAAKSNSYDTPLLDAYYEEIMTYFPGGDQK